MAGTHIRPFAAASFSLLVLSQSAPKNDEYSSVADADAFILQAGDPAGEDEPIRKGTSFQVTRLVDRRLRAPL
jgi:hypothetical protein